MPFINSALVLNPLNWVTVIVMLFIASIALTLISDVLRQNINGETDNG